MIKHLILLSFAALFCLTVNAQFRYTFKDTSAPYVPLAGASSLNAGNVWFGQNYIAPMPFSWKMDSNINVTGMPLQLDIASLCSDTAGLSDVNGFMFADLATLADRGALGFSSLSPIRYTTTGTAPSRIFKLELFSAGFEAEAYYYNTLNDSVNIQIWIYETSNIVELRYGPSHITHPADYFSSGTNAPLIGYLKHADLDFGSTGMVYYIKGNASNTGIDSLSINATTAPANILSAWPANGNVFRFTPKTSPCTQPAASYTSGTPSGKSVQYTYTGTTAGLDSLVWNFGDNQRQKVTAGFSTPVTHTFANNGHYNVCVTAYNSCGNGVSCKQLALSVADLAGLGDVKVYPNPATSEITIEGMEAGGKVTVLSVTGQQVTGATVGSRKQVLDLSALPAGTYMLMLTGKDGARGKMQLFKL